MKNKSKNSTQNIADCTCTKDVYDGNMEITDLKSSGKNVPDSVEPLPESSRPRKDGPGGA